MSNLGEVIVGAVNHSVLDDHFSGYMARPCRLSVRTSSGSRYTIDLPAGASSEEAHSDETTSGTYNVRPGSVTSYGQKLTGLVGFNREHGSLLVLDRNTKTLLLRTSSIITFERLS
jgi:hypothetical protein